jgi:hypothetical protein
MKIVPFMKDIAARKFKLSILKPLSYLCMSEVIVRLFLKYYDILHSCFTLSNDYCIFLISILFILIFQCN